MEGRREGERRGEAAVSTWASDGWGARGARMDAHRQNRSGERGACAYLMASSLRPAASLISDEVQGLSEKSGATPSAAMRATGARIIMGAGATTVESIFVRGRWICKWGAIYCDLGLAE